MVAFHYIPSFIFPGKSICFRSWIHSKHRSLILTSQYPNSQVFLFLGIQVKPVWSSVCLDSDWNVHAQLVVGTRPYSCLYQGRNEESCSIHIHIQ